MGEKVKKLILPRYLLIVIIVIQGLLIIFYGNKKQGFIMDEYYTWMSANSFDNPEFVVPMNQWTSTKFLTEYFTVQKGEQFAFISVWNNLKADVHPPLNSWILHIICSLFTDTLSKWFGLILNLVYAIFITILIYLTAKTVSGNYIVGLAAAFLYSCSNFALSSAMYIRMYQQLVLMISWSCYWHVKNIGECNVKKSRYGLLCVITVLGTITHYHFLIFAFFEAVFYCISKWVCKHKRDVWKYFFSMGISAIISVLIFPPMIRDIFFGYRGTEAFSNLLHGDGYLNTANLVWNIIDNRLLAGIPIYIYVLMIISAIIIIVKQYGSDKKDKIIQLGMLFLPTMGFFLIVVRTAPYITDRYYFGIGAVIAVFIVCIVSIILQYLVKTRLYNALLLSLCVALPIVTLFKMNVNYLNAFNNDQRSAIIDTGCSEYLYIVDENTWKVMDNINILWEMDKVYFTNEKDLTAIEIENTITGDALLVGLPSNNAENILKKVKQIFSYKEEQIVCQNGDTATYYLSK